LSKVLGLAAFAGNRVWHRHRQNKTLQKAFKLAGDDKAYPASGLYVA